MTAFAQHFGFEFRTGIRNRSLLFMNYLFPLAVYLLLGAIFPSINPSFLESMIPAMVTFGVLAATLLGLPDPLINAREAGIFRSYKINGVPAASILTIPALSMMLHLCVVAAIITVTAPLLFDAVLPTNWGGFVVSFLALLIACTGLGVLIGVVAPNTRMSVLLSQLIFLPSMIIGGVMMPFDFLPEAAQRLALLLPSTHGMNAFQALGMGQTAAFNPWLSVGVLVSGGLLAFLLALFLFRWDSRNALRRQIPALGLLAMIPYVLSIFLA